MYVSLFNTFQPATRTIYAPKRSQSHRHSAKWTEAATATVRTIARLLTPAT